MNTYPHGIELARKTLRFVTPSQSVVISTTAGLMFVLLSWFLLSTVLLSEESRWLLPPPNQVFLYLLDQHATFTEAAWETGLSSALGLLAGAGAGFLLAFVFHVVPSFGRALLPFVSTLPAVPIVAIAPLVAVWFGFGITSRVLIVAFITFFPVLVTVLTGLSNGYRAQREYCAALGARLSRRLLYMDLPSALAYFAAGLRSAAPVAVVGAIVAEYVSPKNGLGYLVLTNALRTNVVGVVASALACAFLGLFFVGIVNLICRGVLARFPAD